MSETPSKSDTVKLDAAFAALLCCPNCVERPRLTLSAAGDTLTCERCGRVYPVIEGLPDLRAEQDDRPAEAAEAPNGKP